MSGSKYLDFLPAVYRGVGGGAEPAPFIGEYLKIFEKLFSGIDDQAAGGRKGMQQLLAAEVIGNLFYPRFSFLFTGQGPQDGAFIPPISGAPEPTRTALLAEFNSYIGMSGSPDPLAAFMGPGPQQNGSWQSDFEAWLNDFLSWLGGWVALVPDKDWSIDKKRTVIAETIALYRLRGTPQGLTMLINLFFDLPLTITGLSYPPGSTVPIPAHGQISALVANPVVPAITVSDVPVRAFVLQDRWQVRYPVVSGWCPWLFDVTLQLPNAVNAGFILTADNVATVRKLAAQIGALLDKARPAASRAALVIVPSMQLQAKPWATQLGINTLIGKGS